MTSVMDKKLEDLRNAAKLILEEQKQQREEVNVALRPFTNDEIKEILDVIPKPPTRVPDGEIIYRRQREIVERELRKNKRANGAIKYIKKFIREQFLHSWVPPGTPYGLQISDDYGASAMQGALNTKRTAGAKQTAAAGIKSQREIMFLSDRSNPIVNLVFEEQQSFESIMDYWRPKFVGILLTDLIDDITKDIVIEKSVREPWYSTFEVLDPKIAKYRNTMRMRIKLRKDKLYIFKIDLYEAIKRLEAHKKGKTMDSYSVVYSPPFSNEVYLHIIPNDDTIKKAPYDSYPEYKSLLVLNRWMNKLLATTISGKEGIRSISAIPHPLLSGIKESKDDRYTVLEFTEKYKKFYGAKPQMIENFLRASEIIDGQINIRGDKIYIEDQKFDPKRLKYRNNVAAFTYEKTDDNWIIIPTGEDPRASLSSIRSALNQIKGLSYTVDNKITVKGSPSLNVMNELKGKLDMLSELRSAQEERLRAERIEKGLNTTILTPLNKFESLAQIYTAEVLGGSMEQFSLEIGIDIYRSYSNNAKEINKLLGIIAARNFLCLEIEDVWSNSGVPLQPHSIITMADAMTYRGSLTPSSHNGITSHPIGFLSKATVSSATKHITSAALNGEKDNIQSSSAALMVGKLMKYGTGIVKLRNEEEFTTKQEDTYFDEEEEVEYEATDDQGD